jgi:hypothetical protein
MKKSRFILRLCKITLTYSLSTLATIVVAHDGFNKVLQEGNFEKLELEINHGCDGNPVIAQSVLFPSLNPELSASDSSNNPVPPPNDISELLEGGFLEGLPDLVQDRSIFLEQDEITSELGNTIGFYGKKGFLKANLLGAVPFKFSPLFFTPNSCYSQINFITAIADICSTKAPALQPGKISLFIPDNGSKIGETAKANGAEHGVGEPSRLTVKRDLKSNPFRDAQGNLTNACGEGISVTITPSAEDIDKNLPIPGYWPVNTQQNHHKNGGN